MPIYLAACVLMPSCVAAAAASMLQVSEAAMSPAVSYIASPAASWVDDFLSWTNPALPKCCRWAVVAVYKPVNATFSMPLLVLLGLLPCSVCWLLLLHVVQRRTADNLRWHASCKLNTTRT
jgi:hypothetical protein